MNNIVKEYTKDGLVIRIVLDQDAQNPRTDRDNVGTMVCFHSRYKLGDSGHGLRSVEDAVAFEKSIRAPGAVLPLYLMDHSGLCMSTQDFNDRWDSGKVGFIYVTAEKLASECIEPARAEEILKSEVGTYDCFLRGEVYGYTIESPTGEEIDSCWGYYGMSDVESAVQEVLTARVKVAV